MPTTDNGQRTIVNGRRGMLKVERGETRESFKISRNQDCENIKLGTTRNMIYDFSPLYTLYFILKSLIYPPLSHNSSLNSFS